MAKRIYIPETLTDDTINDPNFFRPDLEVLYDDIERMEILASRLDQDLDTIYFNRDKDTGSMFGRGTLNFVCEQTRNLSAIRTAKNTALNQALASKIKIAQLSLAKRKSSELSEDNTALITREFQKLFLQHGDDFKNTQFKHDTRQEEDTILEERFKSLHTSGSLPLSDNEQAIKYENRGVEFKIMLNPMLHFVPTTKDTGELILDYPMTLYPDNAILDHMTLINGEYRYKNTSYKIYQ
jgi:hypothetical protein